MGKIKVFFRNMTLRKSIVCYILCFALLALGLGSITTGICSRIEKSVTDRYVTEREKYYLTNAQGEQMGEGTYVWKDVGPMKAGDAKLLKLLDVVSALAFPVYSALCLLGAAYLFYRNKLKTPLELLTMASEKISRNELDFSLDYPGKDEMGKLCGSFEIMRKALAENQARMWRTMEERKRLNAAFAHDLRTPLTVLKGYNEMICLTGGPRERETGEIMEKHILRMEHYVDSMSCIRRLEDREPKYQEENLLAYAALLEQVAQVYCEGRGCRCSFEKQLYSRSRKLDGELVQQVYENLLSNGVEYGRAELHVCFLEQKEGLLLKVEDDGPGFLPEVLKRATEPYYSRGRKEKSTEKEAHFGLGLYICQVLCEQHGGWIKLENTEKGACVRAFFRTE